MERIRERLKAEGLQVEVLPYKAHVPVAKQDG